MIRSSFLFSHISFPGPAVVLLFILFFPLQAGSAEKVNPLSPVASIAIDSIDLDAADISDMIFDFEGNLFLLSSTSNRIIKVNAPGFMLAEIGGFGYGTGQFNNPLSIVSRDRGLNLYILDSDNRRIVRLNNDLKWVDEIELDDGYGDLPAGRFEAMAISSTGHFYLSDPRNQRVIVLDENGRYLNRIRGRGFVLIPGRIELDSEDEIYIISADKKTVYYYDRLANFTDSLKTPDNAHIIDLSHHQEKTHCLLSDSSLISMETGLIFKKRYLTLDTESDQKPHAYALTVSPDGRTWIALKNPDRIVAYDPDSD